MLASATSTLLQNQMECENNTPFTLHHSHSWRRRYFHQSSPRSHTHPSTPLSFPPPMDSKKIQPQLANSMLGCDTLFKKIDDTTEDNSGLCPICLETTFASVAIFACCHTSCQGCLQKLQSREEELACPVCRRLQGSIPIVFNASKDGTTRSSQPTSSSKKFTILVRDCVPLAHIARCRAPPVMPSIPMECTSSTTCEEILNFMLPRITLEFPSVPITASLLRLTLESTNNTRIELPLNRTLGQLSFNGTLEHASGLSLYVVLRPVPSSHPLMIERLKRFLVPEPEMKVNLVLRSKQSPQFPLVCLKAVSVMTTLEEVKARLTSALIQKYVAVHPENEAQCRAGFQQTSVCVHGREQGVWEDATTTLRDLRIGKDAVLFNSLEYTVMTHV